MLAVERGWLDYIESAAIHIGIVGIVEPEAQVERVDRAGIALVGIKTEDLIQQDGLDGRLEFTGGTGCGRRSSPPNPRQRCRSNLL